MKITKKITYIFLFSSLLFASTLSADNSQENTLKADIFVVKKSADTIINLKYPTTLTAFNKIDVVARVLGILEKQNFKEGDFVNKGDILYEIEDNTYKALLDEAIASLKVNQSVYNDASRDWKRIKKLYSQKAVSAERRDDAQAAYEQSIGSLALSKAKVQQAQIQYDYTKVKAPISGITGLKKTDLGSLVSANQSKLVQITQIDKIYAHFSIPMSDFTKIKNNVWSTKNENKIELEVEINGKKSGVKGIVDFEDVNVSSKTAIVKMRAVLDNTQGILMPGEFARVSLTNIIQKNTIQVPQKAVIQNQEGTIVFVLEDGIAKVKPVTLNKESGKNFIINKGSIKEGDKIIVNNFFRIKPNSKVIADKTVN